MAFERQQFTFYRSFLNIVEQLPDRKQREFLLILIRYALNETEPSTKDSTIRAAFEGLRPTLDRARRKAQSGKIGGEASGETRSKTEAKLKQNEANAKQVKGKVKDKDIVIGEGKEQGESFFPEEKAEAFHEAFEALQRCNVFMDDKDKAECESLLVQFGVEAVVEATEKARDQNVNRWPYIRKIVTTGGVRPGGDSYTSRRARETNAQCQQHNVVPPPDSAMGRAIREMLDEDFGEEDNDK